MNTMRSYRLRRGVIAVSSARKLSLVLGTLSLVIIGSFLIYQQHSRAANVTQQHFPNTTFIGDSLTAGLFASTQDKDFRQQFLQMLNARDPESGLSNSSTGLSGKTVGYMDTYLTQNPDKNPTNQDLIVIELGTNDVAAQTDLTTFQNQYTSLLNQLVTNSPNALFMCLGVWDDRAPDTNAGQTLGGSDYDMRIQSVCAQQRSVYVDITSLYKNMSYHGPQGVSTFSGTSDWFHPNDTGHAAIADLLLSSLTPYILAPAPMPLSIAQGYFRTQSNGDCCGATGIAGWACQDSATVDQAPVNPNAVTFYANAPIYHSGSVYIGSATANRDVGTQDFGLITYKSIVCGNTTERYFAFPVPASLRDNQPHTIYGYVIDNDRVRNNDPPVGGSLTVTCPDHYAKGYFSPTNCTAITGWACQYPGLYNRVDFYEGTGFTKKVGYTYANIDTGDKNLINITECQSTDHYFSLPVPDWLKDGKPHVIYGYVIDNKTSRNYNPKLGNAPITITCVL